MKPIYLHWGKNISIWRDRVDISEITVPMDARIVYVDFQLLIKEPIKYRLMYEIS